MKWLGFAAGVVCATLALGTAGCTRQDTRLEQHRMAFQSLGATTAFIVDAWLRGQVSGTYTRAALETTYRLVEQERDSLAKRPEALQDSRGAQLSQTAERLSRLIAAMMVDVAAANGPSARRHAADIPFQPPDQP